MPIREENFKQDEDQYFHSCYSIEDLAFITIHKNIEQETQMAYKRLLEHIEENQFKQTTPIYQFVSGDQGFEYMIIRIAVA